MRATSLPLKHSKGWSRIAVFILFGILGLVVPYMGLPQPVTGTLVNALLVLAVEFCGVKEAVFIGMVTPVSAALRGVLPVPLLFMISFISIGNALFVTSYGWLRDRNLWFALMVGASAKFLFLIGAFTVFLSQGAGFPFSGPRPSSLTVSAIQSMMGWIQLLTAFSGGILALVILQIMGPRKTSG